MGNIQNTIGHVKNDDEKSFMKDSKSVTTLTDISSLIKNINDNKTIKEEYKIKYILILIYANLLSQDISIEEFEKNYFSFRNITISDKTSIEEYILDQDIFINLIDQLSDVRIMDILTQKVDSDFKYVLVNVTVEYFKNNEFLLSSILTHLNKTDKEKLHYFLRLAFMNFSVNVLSNLLDNDFKISLDEYYNLSENYLMQYFNKEESSVLKDLLRKKVSGSKAPISRKTTLTPKNYVNTYQNRYCNNLITNNEEFQDELLPLLVTTNEISLPYKKILKFNKDKLYEVPKQTVHTIRLSYKHNNFQGGSKYLYNLNQDLHMDFKWYVNNIKYLENLPIRDKMTIMGYTRNGDVYANNYLMNNNSIAKYLQIKLNEKNDDNFFPLYFQAMDKIIREKSNIMTYFSGQQNELAKNIFLEFVNSLSANVESINNYNLVVKNKKLLSVNFWIDVVKMFVTDLDRIIKQSPPVESTMVVFRGATSKYYKTSTNMYVNNTFMSTSFDYKVPFNFSDDECCVKQIILKPGSRALFTESLSQYPGENEILLGLNNTFKILQDETRNYYNLLNYNKGEEYSDNLCSEDTQKMEVTVMEIVA